MIVEGYSRQDISQKLNISVKTFGTYRAQLMELLDVNDRAELARVAKEIGLIVPQNEILENKPGSPPHDNQ